MDTDESIIVAALGGTVVVSYVGAATRHETLTIKPVLAAFVAGTLLLGVALWSADTAKMFALLLLVTSLAINGKQIFDNVSKVTG